ncbi:uncharacterized protein TRIREDRAFT_120451 [Trichoderma reesei QM6a]|uniref:Predicted protein n=1 Tax=Hypocrea jecorina (strain QM6a) TaxID=431241 RepID=G0RCF4_HYPJQ|nr:uncharacterized protein TRIREDRAFT_120451 [Trichoderma reesei QM6a]EGR51217.1 predicted protein [Trichoderma reesei QM6a]
MAPRTRGSRKAARGPKTPEPFATTDIQPPSPPRPRFRLRRRAPSSNLKAPTQQFLASVATADVPIPSIEEPRPVDEDMVDTLSTNFPRFSPYHLAVPDDGALPRGRAYSPPKTPAPHAVPSLSPKRFPNWSLDQAYSSLESSPECDSRPSTAQSTQTSSSLFSRYSLHSDNLSQYSIDADDADQHGSSSIDDGNKTITLRVPGAAAAAAGASSRRSRRAPWTRSMSQHLWSVYMTYLQDPHVTPFHIGKSGIPPHGVCTRVAREAKRSWKGSKPQQAKAAAAAAADHSGSATPTVGAAPASYVQWPHSCAATRAHLRELCKARATAAARSQRYTGRNPPPFGRASNRYWNRRMAPSRSSSAFSGNDMALSLAVSTCESMQPHGPLAQLTGSQDEPSGDIELCSPPPPPPLIAAAAVPAPGPGAADVDMARLGSPFVARSYGPSASSSLADSFGMDLEPQGPMSSSVGTRRRSLGSPARLSSNSRGSTQKRRSKQQPAAVEPRRKRPSLGSDFWVDPSNIGASTTQAAPLSAEFSSTTSTQRDALFIPRTNLQELFEASQPRVGPAPISSSAPSAERLAPALSAVPARLGSPFSAAKASFSFPGRRSASISAIDFSIIRRPFATVQQPVESESSPPKSSLRSRLAYIDERLKDFRRRDRRSQSPV